VDHSTFISRRRPELDVDIFHLAYGAMAAAGLDENAESVLTGTIAPPFHEPFAFKIE
jgi:hypothetical protein